MYYNGMLDLNTWIFVLMLDLSMSGPLTRVINFFPMFPQVDYTVKQLEALYSAGRRSFWKYFRASRKL